MINTLLRRGTSVLALVCSMAAAVTLAGCGDGIVCQSEILVVIQEPSPVISADVNPSMDGVQTHVEVRSTFGRGVVLTLTVENGGVTLATAQATTGADGDAIFEDVTIPPSGATLRVAGDAGECGHDEDTLVVEVIVGAGCDLELAATPLANEHYAPLGVLNASLDTNPAQPGFQGDVIIKTNPSHEAKLFVAGPGAIETQIGSGVANAMGELRLAVDLPDGQDNLRATCAGPGGVGTRSSAVTSVWVDTVAPTCTITSPVPTTSITPSLDGDGDPGNGIQLALVGHASGADVAGEAASFVITAPGGTMTTLTGTAIDAGGASTAAASFDPDTTPADFGVRFAAEDHAGNTCATMHTYRVVYDGCPIVVTAPLGPLTTDADGDPSNGAQVDVVLDVADECIGRMVTTDCGATDPGAVVGAGGVTTVRATVCDGLPCEATETCTARVTSADGIETTAGIAITFDNQAPNVAVQVAAPAGVSCGGTVTPAQDVDPGAAGTQVRMRVVSPAATTRQLRHTAASGTTTVDAGSGGGEVVVTLDNGGNDFVGIATDGVGNTATSATCRVSLAEIAVAFTGAAADGTVGGNDGTVGGGGLTFTLTGTVSALGAAVEITVDGGAPVAATVVGQAWSLPLTLAARPAPYAIVATASEGPRVGAASLSLVVDVAGPGAVTGLGAVPNTRRSIRLTFTAPDDGGAAAASYRVRYATTALTDANFDTVGVPYGGPIPAAPGTSQSVTITPLRTGTPYWVAIAAVDAAGNRSPAQIAGPLTPAFDQTPAYGAPNTTAEANFGLAMARGRFNDDAFDDVAIAAPSVTSNGVAAAGEVYVYFGSATGLASAPALTIRGATTDGYLGSSLTAIRWSSSGRDDLAIGEPGGDGGSGAIYVFPGGAALPTGVVDVSTAPRQIRVSTTANWFTGAGLGWQLAAADHDGDGTDDLVTTAVFGGGGTAGAAVVLYGGTVPTGTVRISDTSAAGSGTAVIRMYEQPGALFGYYLHDVGRTQGPSDATDDLAVAFVEDGLPGAELIVFRGAGRPTDAGVTREPFTVGRDVRIVQPAADDELEWGSSVGSIQDQNGDGARDLVIGDFRHGVVVNGGAVYLIDGDTVGSGGVATIGAPGVVLTELSQVDSFPDEQLGMAVLNNAAGGVPDVDGDGFEDLVVVGRDRPSGRAALYVWFGPVPPGTQRPAAPNHVIPGPASFLAAVPANGGTPITAIWAGDVNADGLEDICWADWHSVGRDGGVQVLWDDGN